MNSRIDEKHEKLHTLNRRVGLFLRAGTIVSLVLFLAGLIIFIVSGTPHMVALTPISSIIHDLLILNPASLVTAGLIIILIMPLVILITALAHFIVTRETRPGVVCIVLLVMLAASYVLVLK
jgi:uncharacterized membrane protein